MGIFHTFETMQMVPNHATPLICMIALILVSCQISMKLLFVKVFIIDGTKYLSVD